MTIDWTLVAMVLYLIGVVLFGIMVIVERPYTENGEDDSE